MSSPAEATQILRYLRREPSTTTTFPTYDANMVIRLCNLVIPSLPTIEKTSVMEQLTIAYCDIGNIKKAEETLAVLQKIIKPNEKGDRFRLLKAMVDEYKGGFGTAITTYSDIHSTNYNLLASNRMINCCLAKNDNESAIELLREHLDVFMQDANGWAQLAELYIVEGCYDMACFAIEEVLMLKPNEHLHMLRYADLKFALGDYQMSLKYYLASIEIVATLEAWYGVRMCCKNLKELKADGDIEYFTKLFELSKDQILGSYKNSKTVVDWLK